MDFEWSEVHRGTGVLFATADRSLGHMGISAFIVDLESEGVDILKNKEKMGIRGSCTTAFALDGVRFHTGESAVRSWAQKIIQG